MSLATPTALLCVALSVGSFVVNTNYRKHLRVKLQNAVDAAAGAAALEAGLGSNANQIRLAAQRSVVLNGFPNQDGALDLSIQHPPTEGDFSGDASYYEVKLEKTGGLLGWFDFDTRPLRVRAVARTGTRSTVARLVE